MCVRCVPSSTHSRFSIIFTFHRRRKKSLMRRIHGRALHESNDNESQQALQEDDRTKVWSSLAALSDPCNKRTRITRRYYSQFTKGHSVSFPWSVAFSCKDLVFDSLASNMCKVRNPSNVHQSHELKVAFLWMFFPRIDTTHWPAMSLEQTNLLAISNLLTLRKPFWRCNDKKAWNLTCDNALLRMGTRSRRRVG